MEEGEVEATQETEIVDAVSVRVVKDDEVHGTEHVRPEDVTIGTDDLLGGRVVEKEKKGRKRDSRCSETAYDDLFFWLCVCVAHAATALSSLNMAGEVTLRVGTIEESGYSVGSIKPDHGEERGIIGRPMK
eukprot:g14091.t1